jgi:hypothetical protein
VLSFVCMSASFMTRSFAKERFDSVG